MITILYKSRIAGTPPQTACRASSGALGHVKGLSAAPLDVTKGAATPCATVNEARRAADLISVAQLTPIEGRPHIGRTAGLVKVSGRSKLHDVRTVHDVVRRGMGRGLRLETQMRSSWDISGGCLSPVPFEMNGAPRSLKHGRHVRAQGLPHTLLLHVRCRKCAWCLSRRRNLWAFRGQVEIAAAPRTWFGTLTMGPTEHALMRYRASSRLTRGGVDIELLSPREQFEELCIEFGREVTLWLKRTRKATKGKLRYLLVFERHKSGLPHAHILVHDMDCNNPVRHADLASKWKLGFTKFKLCEALKTAWYVAKYLSKSAEARVRASLGYGKVKPSSDIAAQELWPRDSASPATPDADSIHGGPSSKLRDNCNVNEPLSQAGLLSKPANLAAEGAASPSPGETSSASSREAPAPSRHSSADHATGRIRYPPQAAVEFISTIASLWPEAEVTVSMGTGGPIRCRLLPRA